MRPRSPARKPAIGFIFITLVLDVLGVGLLIPVAPRLVQGLLNGGAGGTEQEAAPFVGLLLTTWYAMSFLFAPVLGALSDRVGRRPVILIALLGSGIDFFAQALAPTLTWLFITRAINGISGASMTVANAYIADITPPDKRAAAYGLVGAAFGLGFVIGPVLGGVLGDIDIRLPFYVAGSLTLINWLYGCFVLPESLPPERRSHIRLSRLNPVGAFGILLQYPFVARLAASAFLINMAQFALHATWVLYTGHRYGWSGKQVGLSLALVGITSAFVQGFLTRKIVPRLGERRSLLLGVLLGAGAYAGYGLATEGWMIYAIIAVASLGAIAPPALQALITRAVRPDQQGTVQGAMTGLQSIAGICGSFVGAGAFAYFISDRAPVTLPGAPYLIGAGLAALSLLVALWAFRGHSTDAPSQDQTHHRGAENADNGGDGTRAHP